MWKRENLMYLMPKKIQMLHIQKQRGLDPIQLFCRWMAAIFKLITSQKITLQEKVAFVYLFRIAGEINYIFFSFSTAASADLTDND